MTLPVPELDARRWAEIVEEARARIPRRSDEWTDWNAHDPGITFLELFGWLAEIQRYRLSRVSAETHLRFLRLAGVEPRVRRPARVRVDFEPLAPDAASPRPRVMLPAGTPLTLPRVDPAVEPLGFQVVRDTFVTGNRLRRVTTDTGRRRVDQTQADASPDISYHAFGRAAEPGSGLELEFEAPFEAPEIELYVDLFEDDLLKPAEHGDEPADPEPSVDLTWEFHGGGEWQELVVLEDESLRFHRPGRLRFRTPDEAGGPPFRMRCRVVEGRFEIPPRIRTLRLGVVELEQVETEAFESLERGDGRPDQTCQLAHGGILLEPAGATESAEGTPVIEVGTEDGDGGVDWGEPWERVEDFFASAAGDRHYVLDPDSGEIRFGNGVNGRVPPRGAFVRARRYRHTRGALGNVPPGQRWELRYDGLDLSGTNPYGGRDGRDPEPLSRARGRAAERFHDRVRAITRPDLEELACRTPGLRVARSRALPHHDPGFPCVEVPDAVTVVVVPEVRRGQAGFPVPGSGFLRTVTRHLERHRLLTTSLHVVGPDVVRFSLSARIYLARRSDPAKVLRRLRKELEAFFDPLEGGPSPRVAACRGSGGWPFGRPVHPSEIYERIDLDPGVEYATRVRLRTRGPEGSWTALEVDASLPLPPTGLVDFSWEESELEVIPHGAPASEDDAPCAAPCSGTDGPGGRS